MAYRECCIINCNYSADKESRRTLFKFCEKSPYFETWISAIGPNLRDGNKNRKMLHICDQHFEDLNRSPTKILKDGKEYTVPRRRPVLNSTSVPSIFSDTRTECTLPNVSHTTIPVQSTPKNVFNTTILLKEWNARPSYESMGSWAVSKTACGLFFFLFESTSDYCSSIIQRSLLVKNDMSIELHAHNHSVSYHILEKVTCLQDILFLLRKISALRLCQESCTIGYFEPKRFRSNFCGDCQLKNKREKETQVKRERRAAAKNEKQIICKKNLKQKYKRTCDQVQRYKTELENLKVQCTSEKEAKKPRLVFLAESLGSI